MSSILHDATYYDFLMWWVHFGRESAFREEILCLAALQTGQAVLDVGCGTGTLAVAAWRHVGNAATVCGVDASPAMIARARKKARRHRADINFTEGFAQALPFAETAFDAVFSTIMLHHLPRGTREKALLEIRRVLKPGGCVVIVEFQEPGSGHGFMQHLGKQRHGRVPFDAMTTAVGAAGFAIAQSGRMRRDNLYYIVARS